MTVRILAAEDSRTQAAALMGYLRGAGFEVTLASDGADALARFDAGYDLVVSDVVMPGMDGYELCRAVKERQPQVPVVLLTSLTDPLDVVRALSAGADGFLRKPYEPEELVHRVRTMLSASEQRRSGGDHGTELVFQGRPFRVDASRRQVLDLLLSTFEDLVSLNQELRAREADLARAHEDLAEQLGETLLERDRLQAVLAALPEGLVVTDRDGGVVEVNDALLELIGLPRAAVEGRSLWEVIDFVDPQGKPVPVHERAMGMALRDGTPAIVGTAFDRFLCRSDGTTVPVVARAAPILGRTGEVVGAVGVVEDIGTLVAHDPLTGLPGQRTFLDRLQQAVDAAGDGRVTGVLVVVVDRYDRLRAGLSADGSQRVVTWVVDRLAQLLRSDEVVQRSRHASVGYLGNGELAVLFPDLASESDAAVLGRLLSEQLGGALSVDGMDVVVTVSVAAGLAEPGAGGARVVAGVASAARRASAEGGARLAVADPAAHAELVARLEREAELRAAIAGRQLVVHYQPQLQVRPEAAVGAEALVRWQHPERGLLGAGAVIPSAVESGLIADVSWYVLEEACRQAASWRRSLPGGERLAVSVNVVAEQLVEPDVAGRVTAVLEETGLEPSALVLEITEGTVVDEPKLIGPRLEAIKALGVRLAVDDFGTGYSSLLQLRELPVDMLKVDQRFVGGMTDEPADAAIVAGSIRLARALGLEVLAEGVETLEQLVQLRVLGCDYGQGYHWAKPMPAEELATWWRSAPSGGEPAGGPDGGSEPGPLDDDTMAYLVHELRSPLTAILGSAELLAEQPGDAGDLVRAVVSNARELDSRLTQVAEARAAMTGDVTLHMAAHDVGAIARALVADLGTLLAPHPVSVEVRGPAPVQADRVRVGQALTNLLTNAAKFSPPAAPIEVTVTPGPREVTVSVRDHGEGVPEHRRGELFRRFSRLGSRTKGMGVGLYLARLIAEAHGGGISYAPAPGGGSTFELRLPSAPAGAVSGQAGEEAQPAGQDRRAEGATVLYVEDTRSNIAVVERVLAQRAGIRVVGAPDAATGLALAAERPPDAVLLDLNLPDLPGEEVLRRLRADPRTAGVPVVVASAERGPGRLDEVHRLGVQGVVPKPFDLHDLVATVVAALTGHRAAAGAAVPTAPGGAELLDTDVVAELVELAGDDRSWLRTVVPAFLDDAALQAEVMEGEAAAGRLEGAARAAHALAGMAASFGAVAVARLAREVEEAVAAGDAGGARSRAEALRPALEATERALGEVLGPL